MIDYSTHPDLRKMWDHRQEIVKMTADWNVKNIKQDIHPTRLQSYKLAQAEKHWNIEKAKGGKKGINNGVKI